MPSIAVLIPAYGRPEFLQEALASVYAQRRKPDELIVLDDASPRPLRELVHTGPEVKTRIVEHARNQGPAAAVCTLLDSSVSDLVAFLNDDDVWYPEFLATCEAALVREPGAALAFCDHDVIDHQGAVDAEQSARFSARYGRAALPAGRCESLPILAALKQTVPAASHTLFRRSALSPDVIRVGGSSWDYLAGVSAAGTSSVAVFVSERLGAYRLTPTAISAHRASNLASADHSLSRLRALCWLIRRPSSTRWRSRLAVAAAIQFARTAKASIVARDAGTAVQASLALVGANLLRPAPWPRR